MPALVVAVAAAAAGAAATAAIGSALVGASLFVTAAGTLSTLGAVIAGIGGGLVAAAVSFAGSAILGLNKPPGAVRSAQDRKQMIRSSVAPAVYVYGRARVSGPIVYASSSGEDKRFLHLVIPVAAHPVAGLDAVWINDDRVAVADINSDGFVLVEPFTKKAPGFSSAGGDILTINGELRRSFARVRFYDGTQTAADPDLVAESADGWSAAHVGRGMAYIYVRLRYDADAFPNGIQNIAAEIRGKSDILDPRTGLTGYTENWALCVLDYLRSADGLACSTDEIHTASFITAANVSDENVQIAADASTQKRYTVGGSFALDRTPLDVMDEMLGAGGGTLVYVQGRYRLHAAAYAAPTDTLTVSDLAGPLELVTKAPRRELFNAMRGTFIDPAKNWQASEFPPVQEASAIAADGETIWRDIELPFTNDSIRAQRLARLALRRSREALTLRAPVRYAGIRYSVWQMLSVTIADFGWTDKPFRISAWTFDPESGIVTLTLREEGAASYAWTYDEADSLGPAPDTALVSPFDIPAPVGLAAAESLYVTANGAGVRTRMTLSWVAPAYPFAVGYDIQAREAGEDEWRDVATTQGETRAEVDDLADGLFQFRVRARALVAAGAWAQIQARVGGLAAQPPADVTGLAVQAIGGLAYLRWNRHPDLDVRVGGRIEFRHTPDLVSPAWVSSTGIGEAAPGDATFTVLPLKSGTYLAKAVDAGGRYSEIADTAGSGQVTAVTFTNLDTATEHTAFSGAKTDTIVTSNTLRLDSGGDIDAEASFDAIADLDILGGVVPSGSYAFANGIDLTTVKAVRLTTTLDAVVVNTLDQVDQRAGQVDDWLDFDGAAGGEADAWVEVRQTDDDPAGTPTWSAWKRLDSAEFKARAFEFRAQLRSSDLAFNIHVSELSVDADEVA